MPSAARIYAAVAIIGTLAGCTPTIAIPVVPRIAVQLAVSTAAASWVMTASMLAAATLTVILGRLADARGRRTVLVAALGVVLAGMILAATIANYPVLIAARAMQGCAGALFPVSVAAVHDSLTGRARLRAVAVLSCSMGAGAGGALVIAGLLGGSADYRRVFWFGAGLAAVTVLGAPRVLTADVRPARKRSVDIWGCCLLVAALVALLLPITQSASWGFISLRSGLLLAMSAALFAALTVVERRVPDPVLPRQLLRDRGVAAANGVAMLLGGMIFIAMLIIPLMAETAPSIIGDGQPSSPLRTSVVFLLPGTLAAFVGAPAGAWLTSRSGARVALGTAGAVIVAGYALLVSDPHSAACVVLGFALLSVALNASYAAMPTLLAANAAARDLGLANGLNSLARWIGAAVFTAIATTVVKAGPRGLDAGDVRSIFGVGVGLGLCSVALAAVALRSRSAPGSARAKDGRAGRGMPPGLLVGGEQRCTETP